MIRSVAHLLMGLMLAATGASADVTVFAAASLKGGLDDAAAAWTAETNIDVRLSFAGSSALARQITQGAPADIFISASPDWMDVVEAEDLLAPMTRFNFLANKLVFIGERGAVAQPLTPETDVVALLGEGKLAMALVDAVPAGIYGRTALETLGLWRSVQDRVAQTDNVRAALALVAWGEASRGIVYATDAAAEPKVAVIATFPPESHPPIVYPVAQLKGANDAAASFLAFLSSPRGLAFFAARGFLVPE